MTHDDEQFLDRGSELAVKRRCHKLLVKAFNKSCTDTAQRFLHGDIDEQDYELAIRKLYDAKAAKHEQLGATGYRDDER